MLYTSCMVYVLCTLYYLGIFCALEKLYPLKLFGYNENVSDYFRWDILLLTKYHLGYYSVPWFGSNAQIETSFLLGYVFNTFNILK